MAVIRKIEIRNFRSIKSLDWWPTDGVNCLIGAGDAGNRSVLDAIDYCVGARRTLTISDSDFHNLVVEDNISITLVLGRLNDSLKNYEAYGDFLPAYRFKLKSLVRSHTQTAPRTRFDITPTQTLITLTACLR